MIRDVNLLEYLPPFMQEYAEMQQIMNAEQPDVQVLEDETEIIKNNQFIQSCNIVGIRKFEQLMHIVPLPDDTLDARISRVLTRWNDVVPYTKQTLKAKLDTLCGVGNYTMIPNFDAYTLDIITHLELSGQVDELDYILSYMIPANIVLTARNEINMLMNATAKIASGIVSCETFELSDSFKKDVSIQGTANLGGGIVEGYMTTLSDSFKKEMPIDSVASFAGGIVGSVVVEISDSFNESIDVSGHTAMAAGVSITESN